MSDINQGKERNEGGTANRRISEMARQRVHRILAARHHDEYRELLEEERRKLGYKPLPLGRPKASPPTASKGGR